MNEFYYDESCIICEHAKETLPHEQYYVYCNRRADKRKIEESELDTIPEWCPILALKVLEKEA